MERILVTGHCGMVGSALVREAARRGGCEVLTASRHELDLLDQAAVFAYLDVQRPGVVIIAAAKVGGIHANATYPADFIYENLTIAANLVEGSRRAGISRVLFLGSSCIYPKQAPQPMPEACLLSSPLEPTNEAYAITKIAGLKLCQRSKPCWVIPPRPRTNSDGCLKSQSRRCAPKWSPPISTLPDNTR